MRPKGREVASKKIKNQINPLVIHSDHPAPKRRTSPLVMLCKSGENMGIVKNDVAGMKIQYMSMRRLQIYMVNIES